MVVMFVTATSSVAMAQPSTVDPIAPADEEAPARPVYSRALAERPLLLPDGAFEVDTSFVILNDHSVFLDAATKIHTPLFELAVGLSYRIGADSEREPSLQTLHISGLRPILSCRVPQLAVGAQIAGTTLFGELPGVAPSVIAAYKHTFRPWFGLQGFGLVGYEYTRAVDSVTDVESAQHGLGGAVGARAQLQAGSVFAFEARAAIGYRQDLADYTALGLTSFGSQMLGGMLLLSASDNTDLYFSYDAVLREGDLQRDGITLGLAIRRL